LASALQPHHSTRNDHLGSLLREGDGGGAPEPVSPPVIKTTELLILRSPWCVPPLIGQHFDKLSWLFLCAAEAAALVDISGA